MRIDMKLVQVVAAIIVKDHKVLSTKRGYGEFKGGWEFPGGKIEEGEQPEEALVREIQEELEVEIKVIEKIATIEYTYPAFHLSMQCFLCDLLDEEITLTQHDEAKWLTKDSIDEVEWLPADIEVLEQVKCILSTRERVNP